MDLGLRIEDAKDFSQDHLDFDVGNRQASLARHEDPVGVSIRTRFCIQVLHEDNVTASRVGQMYQAGVRPDDHSASRRQAA